MQAENAPVNPPQEPPIAAKIAIVTGAAGGIGSALCAQIAERGLSLVLIDRDAAKSSSLAATLNEKYPRSVVGMYAVNLADHDDIRRQTARILVDFPRVDILFNNAGVLTESLQFSKYHTELHFEVNVLGALQLIDQMRPALESATGGVVINTTAGISLKVRDLDWDTLVHPTSFRKLFGPYVNSKQALNVLTAALARELAPAHIEVRAADPGPTRTRLTKGAGTPLWMRLFYGFLPSPRSAAHRLFDVGFGNGWQGKTGIVVSGGKVKPLPQTIADAEYQAAFLARCRECVVQSAV